MTRRKFDDTDNQIREWQEDEEEAGSWADYNCDEDDSWPDADVDELVKDIFGNEPT